MDLRTFRKKYNISQYQLADMLGISRSTYRDVEYGKSAPPLRLLKALPKVQKQLEEKIHSKH